MFKEELMIRDEGGKEIIVEVGLAVIGVALLIIFKDAITGLVNSLIETTKTNIENIFTRNVGG